MKRFNKDHSQITQNPETVKRRLQKNIERRRPMQRVKTKGIFSLVLASLLVLGIVPIALAAGTTSGTNVSNTATINYNVGIVPQTVIESSPAGNSTPGVGSGTPTTFVVDNKVDLTVSEANATYTDVIPNAQDQVLVFTVTNDGNTTQDFAVTAAANGTDPFGGTENFDAANVQVFVDVNANGTYEVLTDTATFIDELAEDATISVFVIGDIPAGQGSGDIAAYTLTARAHDAGAAGLGALTNQTVGADTAGVDVVFGDLDGDTDAVRDASFSDTDAFRVLSAQLSIQKAATVIRDPFNLDTNPKHIPGAYIQYVITVSNAATATASAILTTISDTLDANTAIDLDLIDAATGAAEDAAGNGFRVDLLGTTRANQGTPQYFTTTSSVDGVDHDGSATGGDVTATMTTVLPVEAGPGYAAGELQPGESVIITFNVIIE